MKRGSWPNGKMLHFLFTLLLLPFIAMPSLAKAQQVADERLLRDVVSISAGHATSFAVTKDGTAWAWGGLTGKGVLGIGTATPVYSPVPMQIDDVKMISAGREHTLIVKNDGTVWAVGSSNYGQFLGIGETAYQMTVPTQVEGLSDVVAVSAGVDINLALTRDGAVWQWAADMTPEPVEGLPRILAIAAGHSTATALGNGGEVWVWGLELVRSGADNKVRKPTQVAGIREAKAIAAAGYTAAAIEWDGSVWMWHNAKVYPNPVQLLEPEELGITDAVSITGGKNADYSAVTSDGSVWEWSTYRPYPSESYRVKRIEHVQDAISAAKGVNHSLALLKDGTVAAWGSHENGQIGTGSIQRGSLKTSMGRLPTHVDQPTPVRHAISVVINGNQAETSVPPIIINNITYVPVRMLEHLGASVSWTINDGVMINGKPMGSKAESVLLHYTTMVPLRFIAEETGASVKWDADARSIYITTEQGESHSDS